MTDYLLDTQILLWASSDVARLQPGIVKVIEDGQNRLSVSAVSVAEMVIKQAIGKLSMPASGTELCAALGCDVLELTADDCQRMATLPLIHRDPFDRLLIATCLQRDLTLITADQRIWAYPQVQLLRA